MTIHSTWHLDHLPLARCAALRLVALEAARLPQLFTTSLHGALEHALEGLCDPQNEAHRELVLGAAGGSARGVTTEGPRPWSVAPADPLPPDHFTLEEGEGVTVRLALVGRRAIANEGLLIAAVARAAAMGIGLRARGSGRARLRLEGVTPEVNKHHDDRERTSALVDFRSPVRFKRDGEFVSALDSTTLWRGLVRRARMLATAFGDGPLVEQAPPAPCSLTALAARSIVITRWSSRHRERMHWSGVMGVHRLELLPAAAADSAAALWALLRFGAVAQIGSNTQFGFGRYEVVA